MNQEENQKASSKRISTRIGIGTVALIAIIAGVLVWQYSKTVLDIPEVEERIEEEKEEIIIEKDISILYNKKEIFNSLNDEIILTIKEIPYSMKVSPESEFGGSTNREIKEVKLSFDQEIIAIAITDFVHEYAYLYNLQTKELFPIGFSYGGGIENFTWREDSRYLAYETITAVPSIYINIIDTENIPEYINKVFKIKTEEEDNLEPYLIDYKIIRWKEKDLFFELRDIVFSLNPETKEIEENFKIKIKRKEDIVGFVDKYKIEEMIVVKDRMALVGEGGEWEKLVNISNGVGVKNRGGNFLAKINGEELIIAKAYTLSTMGIFPTNIPNIFKAEIYLWDFGNAEDIYFDIGNKKVFFRNLHGNKEEYLKIVREEEPEIIISLDINNPCCKSNFLERIRKPAQIIDLTINEKRVGFIDNFIETYCHSPRALRGGSLYNPDFFLKVEEIKKDFSQIKFSLTINNLFKKYFYLNFLPNNTIEVIIGDSYEEKINSDNWKKYINEYFGFEIKYPHLLNYKVLGRNDIESKKFEDSMKEYIELKGYHSYTTEIMRINTKYNYPDIDRWHPGVSMKISGYKQKLENIEDLKKRLISQGETFTEEKINGIIWLVKIDEKYYSSSPFSKIMYTVKDNLEFKMIIMESPLDKPIIEEVINSFRFLKD